MSQTVTSPNMNLLIPVVGQEIGPQWATDINNCLGVTGGQIDGHDHSFGKGVQIKPAGLDINSNLTFQGNFATNVGATSFNPQASVYASTVLNSIYDVNGNLYFNNSTGTPVQITNGNSIVGTAGSITGLPSGTAGVSYSGGTYTFLSATSVYANMDFGSGFFYNAAGKYVEVSAPVTIAANYGVTLPQLPVVQSFMTLDSSGNMAAPWTVDNSTIKIVSNQLTVPPLGIAAANVSASNVGHTVLTGTTVQAQLNEADTILGTSVVQVKSTDLSGFFSTSSTSWVNVTNMTITVPSTGKPLMLMLVPGSSTSTSSIGSHILQGGTSQNIYFRMLVNGSPVYPGGSIVDALWNMYLPATTGTAPISTISMVHFAPTAGTNVYQLQMQTDGNAGNINGPCALYGYEI
jgi:hypothetical protein